MIMSFNSYQSASADLAGSTNASLLDSIEKLVPDGAEAEILVGAIRLNHSMLGLNTATGALALSVQSLLEKSYTVDDPFRGKLIGELGEVLRSFTDICTQMDIWVSDVAQDNLDRWRDFKRSGVPHSGDVSH